MMKARDNCVELNTAEQKLARYLGVQRYEHNKRNGVGSSNYLGVPQVTVDLDAVGAEIAFCKLFNVYPDTSITGLDQTENDEDDALTVGLGSVDVKQTKYQRGSLLAVRRKGKKLELPDHYVLMIGKFPRYRYVGYVHSSKLIRDENLKDYGNGECYSLPQSALETGPAV